MTFESCYEDVVVQRDVWVPMRDGVRLATDVYFPARDGQPLAGRFPVVLERTPYGKNCDSRSEIDAGSDRCMPRAEVARTFTQRGYVVVYQDCRGRYASEGHFVKYLSEAADGEDTMRWLMDQPWCDGNVGTKGLSYCAHVQMALACQAPPGLKTFILDCGGFSNAYQGGIRQGGAFELKQVTWAFARAKEEVRQSQGELAARAFEQEDLHAWFKRMPWRRGHSPLRWMPEYEDYLFEQWSQGSFGPYWKQSGLYAEGHYDQIPDVPQVHMSSWYDVYVRTALDNYVGLSRRKRGPVMLIMGPWLHGDRNVTHCGDVEFGPAAALDGQIAPNWREFRANWFDRWIKGVPNGVDLAPRVRLFLMGGGSGRKNAEGRLEHGGRWIASADWPLPDTREVEHYLHLDSRLDTVPPTEDGPSLSYDFDPEDPVPTIGGSLTSGKPIFEGGAFDQREDPRFFGSRGDNLPLDARPDVLCFQTEPLAEDTAVIGPIVATLFVSSNCLDTDFTVKLVDVHPPSESYPRGFAMNITDGILRCRYRDSWEEPKPMVPGEVVEIRVECFATANLFLRGHRIRIDVSSSNFPKYDVNPNTGEEEGSWRVRRVATNTVFLDSSRPSRVTLPIVPVDRLRDMAGQPVR